MILFEFPSIIGLTNAGIYKNCILLNSVDFEIGRQADALNRHKSTKRDTGYKNCSTVVCSRNQDSSSVQIITTSLQGTMKDAKIHFLENDNRCFLQLSLRDCLINQIKFSAHGAFHAQETFYLTFTNIDYRSIPIVGSPCSTGFDLMTGA